MELQYTELGTGKRKVLFDDDLLKFYRYELEKINQGNDCHFYFLKRNQFQVFFKHNIFNYVPYRRLDRTYKKSKDLQSYYNELFDLITNNQITHFVVMHTGQYRHPNFVNKLKDNGIGMSLWTADDDSNTIKYCSLPYTRYYDHHFHVGVMFDMKRTIADVLKEHGSKNPIWIPLGAMHIHSNEEVNFGQRDIDICYIGNVNPLKLYRLSKLKRHFGNRFKLYGAQGNGDRKSLKGIFYKLVNKIFSIGYVQRLSDDELKEVYSRTKIGFNMHLVSYKGPSNMRLYELPINGVMQLCDNEMGLSKIFKVGKEIVAYNNINDAIQKIEYYLNNDAERKSIAKAGYDVAYQRYTSENTLKNLLLTIFQN